MRRNSLVSRRNNLASNSANREQVKKKRQAWEWERRKAELSLAMHNYDMKMTRERLKNPPPPTAYEIMMRERLRKIHRGPWYKNIDEDKVIAFFKVSICVWVAGWIISLYN